VPNGLIFSGWSALLAAAAGVVAMWVGMNHGPDGLSYVGLILIVIAVCLAVASLFSSRRPLAIVIAILACVPASLFALLMYRLSGDTS
jgi:hypothetical protein